MNTFSRTSITLIAIFLFILSFSLVSAFGFQNADIVGDLGFSRHPEMGDLDGDGDLDIYVAQRANDQNKIWINNGDGTFTNNDINAANGTIIGGNNTFDDRGISYGASLADFDNDGDLDIYTSNDNTDGANPQNRLWINQGDTNADGLIDFINADIAGDTGFSWGNDFGDFDGNGFLDIYVVNNGAGRPNRLWLNQGDTTLDGLPDFINADIASDSGSGPRQPEAVDIDADGDIDIFIPQFQANNIIWYNDGSANFTQYIFDARNERSRAAAFEDYDGDGDLDVYVINYSNQQNRLWLNQGDTDADTYPNFTSADIAGDTGNSHGTFSADFENDGDMDLYVPNTNQQNWIWLNDGTANFTLYTIPGDTGTTVAAMAGDLDGDNGLDIYVANIGQNKIWLNVLDVAVEQSVGQDDPTGDTDIDFTVTFSASIVPSSFIADDITISSSSGVVTSGPTEIAPNDGTTFQFSVTGVQDAEVVIASIDLDLVEATSFGAKLNQASTSIDNEVTYLLSLTPPPSEGSGGSGSSGGNGGSVRYICADPEAINYNDTGFGRPRQSMCEYDYDLEINEEPDLESSNEDNDEVTLSLPEGETCPYFNTYLRRGDAGSEVAKLQDFLNKYMGASITMDGTFGGTTARVVKDFQQRHAADILDPWNLPAPTGYVYKTTSGIINEIVGCQTEDRFLEGVDVLHSFDNDDLFDIFDREELSSS